MPAPAEARAITVKQPWAWAIAHGGKTVENRSRGTRHRGLLLIHAGLAWSDRGAHDVRVTTAGVSKWPVSVPRRDDTRPPGESREAIAAALARTGLKPEFYSGGGWSRGAVIAVAQLVDSHPDAGCCRPWGESSYTEAGGRTRTDVHHLVLEHVDALVTPVPASGALGLWRPDAQLLTTVLDSDVVSGQVAR